MNRKLGHTFKRFEVSSLILFISSCRYKNLIYKSKEIIILLENGFYDQALI